MKLNCRERELHRNWTYFDQLLGVVCEACNVLRGFACVRELTNIETILLRTNRDHMKVNCREREVHRNWQYVDKLLGVVCEVGNVLAVVCNFGG